MFKIDSYLYKTKKVMKTNDEIPKNDKLIVDESEIEVGGDEEYEIELEQTNISDFVSLIDCVKNYYTGSGTYIDMEDREQWKVAAGIQKENGNSQIPASINRIIERCFKSQLRKFV